MSNSEHERDERTGESSFEDALWGAEGGGESVVHDPEEPGFDNREARDTLSESLDDPVDAIPRDPEDEPAPKKKSSNLPFYGAVGAFAVVALGLVGYKSGLIGGSPKKPIEPTSVASAMASETPKKPESLIGAAGASNSAAPDLLSGGEAKSGSQFDAEADLLSEKSSGPAPAPAPPASDAPAALSAPVVIAQEAPKTTPPAQSPAVAPVAPPAAPVAVVEKPVPNAAPVEVVKAAAAPAAPAQQTRSDPGEPMASAKAARRKQANPVRVAIAPKPAAPMKVAVRPATAAKPVHVVEARKPSRGKGAGKVEKDATPESKEVLAGWKLRGTWPNHGPSQLAWIADDSGRLTTVSVGTRISGARVLSIGKRGEVVQTTAGQILP